MSKTEKQAEQIGQHRRKGSAIVALKGFKKHSKTLLENDLITPEEHQKNCNLHSDAVKKFMDGQLG